MNKTSKLLTLVEDAINGIKQEIEKGDQRIDSSEHLQFIFSVLLETVNGFWFRRVFGIILAKF
ncbi:MAG: hypothetical protein K1X28_02535 [Parachlamydiales bacterium]|nr:hypothetical protein [Parachlamydiales bacterium]